jgi:hypothetical protein
MFCNESDKSSGTNMIMLIMLKASERPSTILVRPWSERMKITMGNARLRIMYNMM